MPTTSAFLPFSGGVGILSGIAWFPIVLTDQPPRVAGNHEFLIGREHPGLDATGGSADGRPVFRIGCRVEFDAEPSGIAANAFANCGCFLADAACKHQRIESADRSRQRTELA